MAKQFLHGADIGAVHEQVCGKGMPQGMRRHRFYHACPPGSLLHRLLQVVMGSKK